LSGKVLIHLAAASCFSLAHLEPAESFLNYRISFQNPMTVIMFEVG